MEDLLLEAPEAKPNMYQVITPRLVVEEQLEDPRAKTNKLKMMDMLLEDPEAKPNMYQVITPNSPRKKLDNPA